MKNCDVCNQYTHSDHLQNVRFIVGDSDVENNIEICEICYNELFTREDSISRRFSIGKKS